MFYRLSATFLVAAMMAVFAAKAKAQFRSDGVNLLSGMDRSAVISSFDHNSGSDISASDSESDSDSFEWLSNIGGDLFITGESYGLHLSGVGSVTVGTGLGAEIRVHPFFLGLTAGFSGDEGIPYIHPSGAYSSYSLNAGMIINHYRVGIGQIYADSWSSRGGGNYTADFLGISRRVGGIFFFEPEVKLMFPVVAHYWVGNDLEGTWVTQHYHLRDLYFSFSLKLGIGHN